MIESEFWAQARPEFVKAAAGIHITRIESSVSTGVSDVTMCFKGREAWVELKMMRSGRLKFRPSQRVWIPKRLQAGGRVRVLAREDEVNGAIYVLSGEVCTTTGDVRQAGLTMARTSPPYDWKKLLVAIFSV